MASAADELGRALAAAPIRDAACPIVANVSAKPVQRGEEIRAALAAQLLGAVRWGSSMRWLLDQGASFVELGAGTVLRGLLRSTDKQARSWNIEDSESLQATLAGLGAPAGTPEVR
jgi:[acyl-carrier-protein] S-malonyltransferase